MKRFINRLKKYVLRIVLVLAASSAVLTIISMIFKAEMSWMFTYAGLVYMVIGGMSLFGNAQMTSNSAYTQARSVAQGSVYDNSVKDFKSRDRSMNFLVFMGITGMALFLIGSIMSEIGI